jgi:hypothetical protein
VHGEQLIVELGADKVVAGHSQLSTHQQCQNPRQHEEKQRRAYVKYANVIVIDCGDEPQPSWRLPQAFQYPQFFRGARERAGQFAH